MFDNLLGLLKGAKDFKKKIEEIQEELATKMVKGSSGGGMVEVTVNGRHEVVTLTIDKELLENKDSEMIQDLVMAAINDGLKNVKELLAEEMKKITGGLDIPGLF